MQTTVVYACVRILAESVASLLLHVYEYKGQGKERVPQHSLYFLRHESPDLEMTFYISRNGHDLPAFVEQCLCTNFAGWHGMCGYDVYNDLI